MSVALLMYTPGPTHVERLRAAAPGWGFTVASAEAEAQSAIGDADVVLGNRYFLQALPYARRLRWMQSNSVGMDLILSCPLARTSPFVLTNARGVYHGEVADHALALALSLVRGLPAAWDRQRQRDWRRAPSPALSDVPTLVFGFGGVGQAIARRLLACDAPVRVVARTVDGPGAQAARAMGVACLTTAQGLDALSDAGLVVLALPLTPHTRQMFGARALGRLPEGALLVNVARGELIDERALEGIMPRLGGVALDVCAPEPPPSTSWLWRHPKVRLTPHVGRSPEIGCPRWYPLFERNLARYVQGQPLLNEVDKTRGY